MKYILFSELKRQHYTLFSLVSGQVVFKLINCRVG